MFSGYSDLTVLSNEKVDKVMAFKGSDLEALDNLCLFLDTLPNDLGTFEDYVTTEAYASPIVRLLIYASDLFIRIFHAFKDLFKLSLFRMTDSEFSAFYSSHTMMVKKIENIPYIKKAETIVPVPTGLKKDYLSLNLFIKKGFTHLKGKESMKSYFDNLSVIYSSVMKGNFDEKKTKDSLRDKEDDLKFYRKEIEKNILSCYGTLPTGLRRDGVKFAKCFKSPSDIKKVREETLKWKDSLLDAKGAFSVMEDTEKLTDNFITKVEEDRVTITGKELKTIALFVKNSAEFCECYGKLLKEATKFEHNFVEVYRKLKKIN